MSNKFTEEKFKKLVKIQEKYFPITMIEQGASGKSPYDAIHESSIKLSDFIWTEKLGNEAVALMNPLTREWAHDKFVEKEKKYVWTLKRTAAWNGVENYKRLFRTVNGDISDVLKEKDEDIYEEEYLTETDIKEWGYNPEMFDKEEV